jgi:hypothetical protein
MAGSTSDAPVLVLKIAMLMLMAIGQRLIGLPEK